MKRKSKKTTIVIILLIVVCAFILPVTIFHLSGLLLPTPPTPINKYGEFPFRIVYEIGDERYIVEDTLVCEYAGRNREGFTGRELKWTGHLLSGDRITDRFLGYDPDPGSLTEWVSGYGIVILDHVNTGHGYISYLEIDIGSAEYYLGYYLLGNYSPGKGYDGEGAGLDDDALYEKYRVRIIETVFTEPLTGGNGIDMILLE